MTCETQFLGRVSYADALALQGRAVERCKAPALSASADALFLLEHPHVYTLGRNARREHLLIGKERLRALGAELYPCDRGGDITYHGPGQLVGYPILDLRRHRRDVGWYMRSLEEVLIRTANDFGVKAERRPGFTGVWVEGEKLASLGVHLSRWVTSHGFAFNVNTDLTYFEHIVPCGLSEVRMTSLEKSAGRKFAMEEVSERVVCRFADVFDVTLDVPVELRESLVHKVPVARRVPA